MVTDGSTVDTSVGSYMIGFPEPTYDIAFSAAAGSTKLPGAKFTVWKFGNTEKKWNGTAGADGVATISLPAGSYLYTIDDIAVGDKTYTMKAADKANGKPAEITSTTKNVDYTDMTELTAEYPIRIKVTDKAGTAIDLSTASMSFAGKTLETASAANGEVSFTTASSGNSLKLLLSGISGYQSIADGTALINVTPKSGSTTEATLSTGTNTSKAEIAIETDTEGQYIAVKLSKNTTHVTIPLPKPDGEKLTDETAGEMTVTVKPVEGSENTDVPSSGVTTGKGQITVNADGTLNVPVDLPDGAYDVVISGPGLQPITTTVTVITDNTTTPPKRVVNVGGTPTVDESTGAVTGVTGGGTAVTEDAGNTDADGNGTVDLTGNGAGTTITSGGNVTVGTGGAVTTPDPSDEDVTEIPGGLLEDTNLSDKLKPGVDTDPMYYVDIEPVTGTAGAVYTEFKAQVYLQNAKGSSGSFGMYFDPTLFTGATLSPESIIELDSTGMLTGGKEIETNFENNGYVAFQWRVAENGAELDSITKGQIKLATITLTVSTRDSINVVETFQSKLDDRSIYTMSFADTRTGKGIENAYKTANPAWADDMDAYQSIMNESMGSVWRNIKGDPASNFNKALEDEKATRGGFYQYYGNAAVKDESGAAVAGDGEARPSDIKMKFNLPEFIEKQRVDFWVTNPSVGIPNASIYISETADALKDVTNATTKDDLDTLGVTKLTTDENGYAHISQSEGKKYYYKVLEDSHWAYPDGTSNEDVNKPECDSYTVSANGGVPDGNAFPAAGGYTNTPVTNGYINPQMNPKTFHEVELLEKDAGTAAALEAEITSPKTAYNNVTYYFSVEPKAGHTWNLGTTYTNMADIAAAMEATLYVADPDDTSTVEKAFRTKTTDDEGNTYPVTVQWNNDRQMFYIISDQVKGDGIGKKDDGTNFEIPAGTVISHLRAGDLVLKLPADTIGFASYTIKATAGTGGKVAYTADTTLAAPGTVTTDGTTAATAGDPYQALQEALTGGLTTSAKYTFTPDTTAPDGYTAPITIDKVFINGVEQTITDQQKTNGYTYQFLNVSGDQNIYVTFKDKDNKPLSDPYITVNIGANGSAEVTGTDPDSNALTPNQIPGGGSASYVTEPDGSLTIKVTPDDTRENIGQPDETGTKYVIDQIVVDGTPITFTPDPGDGSYTLSYPDAATTLGKGDTHSVVVTFKPEDGDSTHVVVTATVVKGFGTLSPVGMSIYPVGATPTYSMKPDADWHIGDGSVEVDGVVKTNVTGPDASGVYTYTMDALSKDTALDITFLEDTVKVLGAIELTAKTVGNVEKATLTFVRDKIGDKDKTTITVDSGTVADGTHLVSFNADIPAGTWTVTVEKQGYLDYIITNFEVKKTDQHIHFGSSTCDPTKPVTGDGDKCAETPKPIKLTPGDAAGEGLTVAFNDAAVVVAGWLNGATATNKRKGDIDENRQGANGSNSDDMSYVQQNLYKKRTKQTYDTFKA